MSKTVKLGGILFAITAVTGLVLGVVKNITDDHIAAAAARQKQEALMTTLPGADSFTPVTTDGSIPAVLEIFRGTKDGATAGYDFTIRTKGFGGMLTLVAGINNEGKVMDIVILESNETPGLGARASEPAFAGQFHERLADGDLTVTKTPAENVNQIQAISGATITSKAVTGAVNIARAYWNLHFKGEK